MHCGLRYFYLTSPSNLVKGELRLGSEGTANPSRQGHPAGKGTPASGFDPFRIVTVRSFNSANSPAAKAPMNAATRFGRLNSSLPADAAEEGHGLPAWIYHDAEFFEQEKSAIFRSSWQIVCHLSDVPRPGDFHSFDFLGESIIVLRGDDGEVQSFHNVCRHRAARLLDGSKGHCGRRITCPYHAWTYALDGRLVG